jgi:iron complex outermembrane receptor protein
LTAKARAAFVAALSLSGGGRARADGNPNVAPVAVTPFETVVTAPPRATPAPREDRSASASVVLPGDSPRAHDDVGTLMTEVPGVTTTRTGALGSFTTLSLRGSNPDQVRFVIDGVPIAIAEGGAVDVSTLPLGDVERVEVYRGQAPLAFGESALGGIVSITTHTPGTPSLGARAGMGSFGAYFGDAHVGGRLGRLRLYLGAHALSVAGGFPYANDAGTSLNPMDDTTTTRSNNDVAQVDGTLRAAVDLPGRRTIGLGVIAFGRDQGLPGQHFAQTRFVRFATGRGLAYLRYESRDDLGDGGRLTAQLFASGQRDHYTDPGELSAGPWNTRDTTLSVGASVNAARAVASWLRAAAVIEGRDETFRPENDGVTVMPVGQPARRLAAVGGVEGTFGWRWADLDVIPSVRVELAQDVVTGRDPLLETNRAPDPPISRVLPIFRLGFVRPFGAHATLKANVGRYARVPSFLELYAGTGRLLGNPTLQPERGTNGDVALEADALLGERAHLSTRTAAFGAVVDDLIEWRQDSYGHSRADNIGAARIVGAEQEVRVALGRWGRFTGQATFLEALDASGAAAHDGKQLPNRPRWQAYARPELARLHLPRGAAADAGVDVGAFVDAALVAGVFDDPANLAALPTRFLLGAGLSAGVPRWGLRAVLSGQDLARTWSDDTHYWPVPGRTVYLALAWQTAVPAVER